MRQNTQLSTNARRDERRVAILAIARRLFLDEGYAISMSTIAARVGGSKATLYSHFSSKEALFAAVIEDLCDESNKVMLDLGVEGGDIVTALNRFGRKILSVLLSPDMIALNRLVTAEAVRFPELGVAYMNVGLQSGREHVVDYFREAMAARLLRPSDPVEATQFFMALCLSHLHRRRLWNVIPDPTPQEIAAHVARVVDMFMYGCAPRSQDAPVEGVG